MKRRNSTDTVPEILPLPVLDRKYSLPEELLEIRTTDSEAPTAVLKPLNTSYEKSLEYWASEQFDLYSDGTRMGRDDFRKWIQMHKYILEVFKEIFHKSWWGEFQDQIIGVPRSNFSRLQPNIYAEVSFIRAGMQAPERAKLAIYDSLLLVFGLGDLGAPIQVSILKELHFEFFDIGQKIEFLHSSEKYLWYELTFPHERDFDNCRRFLVSFSHYSVFQ